MRRTVFLSLRAIGIWILTGTVMDSRLIAESEPSFFSDSPVASANETLSVPDETIGIRFGRQDESPKPESEVSPHASGAEPNHQDSWLDQYSRPEGSSKEESGYLSGAYGERESALSAADGEESSSEVQSVPPPASQVDDWHGATALAGPSPDSDEMGRLFDSSGQLVGVVKRVTIDDSVGLLVVDTAGNPKYLNLPSGDGDSKVYRRFKVTGANYTVDNKYEGTTVEREENSDVLDRRVFEFVGEGLVPTKKITFVPAKSKKGAEPVKPAGVDHSDAPTTPLSFFIDPALSQQVGTNP